MSETVIEVVAVDPRIPEAVELIRVLSDELAGRTIRSRWVRKLPAGGCFGYTQGECVLREAARAGE